MYQVITSHTLVTDNKTQLLAIELGTCDVASLNSNIFNNPLETVMIALVGSKCLISSCKTAIM